MHLVSVIIPCYNQGNFLSEALNSVFLQTYPAWECIVVNDGSTDNTEQVAEAWVKRDKRFRYVHKKNGGLSSARNAGLSKAQGAYLQFLDADDMLDASKLAKQLNDLQDKPKNTVAVSNHFPFDHQTNEYVPRLYVSPFIQQENFKKEIVTEWEFRRSIPPHSPLVPRNLVSENHLVFSESLPTHEDWVFWCQLFYFASGICFQEERLAKFRMHSTSMSNNKQKMAEGFLAATFILETFYNKLGATDFIRSVRKIRKEVKNNLFPHSQLHNFYAELKQQLKTYLLPKQLQPQPDHHGHDKSR